MVLHPRLLGAMAAVLVAGVAGGAVLGEVPPLRHAGLDAILPPDGAGQRAFDLERAPHDQYAIVTPEGRFEVSQLADRGLYRNARFSPVFAVGAYDDHALGTETPVDAAAGVAADDFIELPAEAPPESEAQAAPTVATVTPRVIDVSAELAARRPRF